MPSWNHDDRALDAELHAARPQPRAEVTQSIADRVRPRRGGLKRRMGKLQLALAGGLTALALTPVVAMGGGFGVGSFGGGIRGLDLSSLINIFQPADDDDAVENQYTEAECDALVSIAGNVLNIPIDIDVLENPTQRALLQIVIGVEGITQLEICIGGGGT